MTPESSLNLRIAILDSASFCNHYKWPRNLTSSRLYSRQGGFDISRNTSQKFSSIPVVD